MNKRNPRRIPGWVLANSQALRLSLTRTMVRPRQPSHAAKWLCQQGDTPSKEGREPASPPGLGPLSRSATPPFASPDCEGV